MSEHSDNEMLESPKKRAKEETMFADAAESPPKVRRSAGGAGGVEEDFTSFVESALSPLATDMYNQSADNSRDAPMLPSSHRSVNSSQQHFALNAPSSNEWSPTQSQTGFGSSSDNGNDFKNKTIFPEAASPSGGSFAAGANSHPKGRMKKKEGGGDSSSSSSSSHDHLQNSRHMLAARIKDGKGINHYYGTSDDSSSVGGGIASSGSHHANLVGGRDRSNSNGSYVGGGSFPLMIPGYAQSTLELEEDSLGAHRGEGEMHIAHSPRKGNGEDDMQVDTHSSASSTVTSITSSHGGGAVRTTASLNLGGVSADGIITGSRARRKTPKAAETKIVQRKSSSGPKIPTDTNEYMQMGFNSFLKGNYQEPMLSCNCKKSRCLKLYCECFHALKYCQNCNCYDCENRAGNDEVREAVIATIKERNPDAFDSKVKSDESGTKGHMNGCHCKRSACLKKYCECFTMAVPCGIKCRCLKCQNTASLYQLKGGSTAAYTAQMLVTAAAASLNDTGEDYLKYDGNGNVHDGAGSSYQSDSGNRSPVVTIGQDSGSGVTTTMSPMRRSGGLPPPSPGSSLLELAGACTEQQSAEDTAQGLLALSPQRSVSSAQTSPYRNNHAEPLPQPKFE